jgi:ribosomal-protein-alanine N-acetyltransferase
MIIFQTSRLLVRPYSLDDSDRFFALNGNPEVVRYIRPAKSKAECDLFLKEIIEAYRAAPLYGRWAVLEKSSSDFVGSFALIPVEGLEQMQVGYALLPAYWGLGYATELCHAELAYVFEQTSIDPIYAYAEAANEASHKVLLKAGLQRADSRTEGAKELYGFRLSREAYYNMRKAKP